jgi:F-type H+-transporting ATPase subunit beta
MFNVLGNTIDGTPNIKTKERHAIHKKSPSFTNLTTKAELLETGIKVIDLLAPMLKGGKVGLF